MKDFNKRIKMGSYNDFFNYFISKLEFDSAKPGDYINFWDEKK